MFSWPQDATSLPAEILHFLLERIEKPARYIGGEVGAVVKEKAEIKVNLALCFPDIYEVAESHLGLKILYDAANKKSAFAAERVYAVWPDLGKLLQKYQIPLWSLETHTFLRHFAILGFTLQYELSYPTIVKMLAQGGVSLKALERQEEEPLVIGGGIGAYAPLPLEPFFDAFFLGDGEEGLLEILELIRVAKEKKLKRQEILKQLTNIKGVYVPHLCTSLKYGRYAAVKRTIPDLEQTTYPESMIVPHIEPVHKRLAVEIQRGCTRGCRFCQAGMTTRPTRQRDPNTVLRLGTTLLAHTGMDELGFLSLSAGDYAPLPQVLQRLVETPETAGVKMALPSLRTDSLTPDLVAKLGIAHKTNFTCAPEAGSDRLRRVINKNNTAADLLEAVKGALTAGYKQLKFYFMLGLPTETEEDLKALIDLVLQARKVAKSLQPRATLTVSVSTFVPKPHTPFQWERQLTLAETSAKQNYLYAAFKHHKISFRYHDPQQSWIEGILARGDQKLAKVISKVALEGEGLDSWTEHFNYALWEESLKILLLEDGLEPEDYLAARPLTSVLPWDHLFAGVTKEFLLKERERAYAEETTVDCALTKTCHLCGICQGEESVNKIAKNPLKYRLYTADTLLEQHLPLEMESENIVGDKIISLLIQYSKENMAKYLAHLDVALYFERALRSSSLPLVYTSGYNRRINLNFSPACPLGIESLAEYVVINCYAGLTEEILCRRVRELAPLLPQGLNILTVKVLELPRLSIAEQITHMVYKITFGESVNLALLQHKLALFLALESCWYECKRKERLKRLDLRQLITEASFQDDHSLRLTLELPREGTVKIREALQGIFAFDSLSLLPSLQICKEKVLGNLP